jgi:hypothetical protein
VSVLLWKEIQMTDFFIINTYLVKCTDNPLPTLRFSQTCLWITELFFFIFKIYIQFLFGKNKTEGLWMSSCKIKGVGIISVSWIRCGTTESFLKHKVWTGGVVHSVQCLLASTKSWVRTPVPSKQQKTP